jgi:hypothetical protein
MFRCYIFAGSKGLELVCGIRCKDIINAVHMRQCRRERNSAERSKGDSEEAS